MKTKKITVPEFRFYSPNSGLVIDVGSKTEIVPVLKMPVSEKKRKSTKRSE